MGEELSTGTKDNGRVFIEEKTVNGKRKRSRENWKGVSGKGAREPRRRGQEQRKGAESEVSLETEGKPWVAG